MSVLSLAMAGRTPQVGSVADLARPDADIRSGWAIAFAFFVLFLGWAAFARLDASAHASGELTVSGERQAVQHRDGGVVSAIHVREGQKVRQGQVLVSLSSPELEAQVRSLRGQASQLLAQRARAQAILAGAPALTMPAEFAALSGTEREDAMAAMRQQEQELRLRRATLAAQVGSLGQRVGEFGQQGRGYAAQSHAAGEQIRLIDDQLNAYAPLVEKGFVSRNRVRELERARAALEGERGQSGAASAQSGAAAGEAKLLALGARRQFEEQAIAELRDIETRLGDVLPRLAAAREQLSRTQVRAPASGAVLGLSVVTPGGVVAGGQKLMEIVPEHRPLVTQVRIAVEDVDDLHPGARALVRFPGLHDRSLPDLEGTLVRLSADSVSDERAGLRYFTGDVAVPAAEYEKARASHGAFALRAGMPVQVLFPLRARTALDYLLEPFTGGLWGAMGEH